MTTSEFEAVFEAHQDAVYRFAWRMTGVPDAAEDIAQDVFLSLWRHPDRFDPGRGGMRPFLLGIARNLALKRWRREHRWEELDGDHLAGPPPRLEGGLTADLVGQAVRALPPLQRDVLILAEYEELSLEEVARTVESEVGTVKSRLHRARRNLRRLLAPLRSAV